MAPTYAAIIYCASLSGYNETLREDDAQNRMKEALLLFDEITNSPWCVIELS